MRFVRKPRDFWFGALFFGFSALLLEISSGYPLGTARQMGPGYFPMVLCVCMAGLSLILIGGSFFGEPEPLEGFAMKPLLLVLTSSLAFGLLARPAGMFPAALVVVLIAALAADDMSWIQAGLLAFGLAAGCVLLFVYGLGQTLPVFGYWFG